MRRRLVTLFLAVAMVVGVFAYDFQSGDLYYNITSKNAPYTVEVTYKSQWKNYLTQSEITIPKTVTYNGKTYSVTSIGESAFCGCSGLTSIIIPESVTSIGGCAFRACSNLTSVLIPGSVTSIGHHTFYRCSALTSFTIPESVTSIGESAFSGCSALASVTIPDGVTSIGEHAFRDCSGLASVTIPNSVTSIESCAFWSCSALTSVTIPKSVTWIGWSVFRNCTGLTSLVVESGNRVCDSRNNCNAIIETETNILIAGCQTTIIPESVTSIGENAFSDCTSLTSITIPNSVTGIGKSAFSGCSGLTSVTIPDGVTSIGIYAFDGCSVLASVTIPNSVTSIGKRAFHGCWGLASVTIGNSVTTIGEKAFGYCSALTSLTIPDGVTSIGDGAFYGCSGLESIVLKTATPPAAGESLVSDYSLNGGCLYVPCGAVRAYQKAKEWRKFTQKQTLFPYTVSIAANDSLAGAVQIDQEPTCGNAEAIVSAIPDNGYEFVQWSDGNTDNPRKLLVDSDINLTALFR